jgi:predicted Zn-dependent protease
MTLNRRRCLAILLPLCAPLLATCAVNPATGAHELNLVSESEEISMGREAAASVPKQTPYYADSGVQSYVRELGLRLAAHSERPGLPWEFHVVDDPAVNAFALPGGFIFVTRGIMTDLNSEAELASVMGHEIGHVTARHSAQQITRQQIAQVGLVAGSIASSTFAQYAGTASQGLQLLFLKFSRDDESQADMLGFRYALRTGYDVRAMRDVFVTLDGVTRASGGGRLPEWQSTHPAPANRISATDARIASTKVNYDSLSRGTDAYLRVINGMIYGENPRDGYFSGGTFYHPDLRFSYTFPAGWKTANQASGVAGLSAGQDAMIELSLADGSAEQAAQKFFATQGIQSAGVGSERINGLPAVSGDFSAQGTQTTFRGRAAFLSFGGRTYSLIGYSSTARWPQYDQIVRNSFGSFRELTDPKALGVQPMRLRIEKLPRAMTLRDFNRSSPSVVPLAELCLVNRVDSLQTLPAGRPVKRVVEGGGK